ncbi:MAG: (2Fe-2S)-binding protein [Nannocystaceae bacterium]
MIVCLCKGVSSQTIVDEARRGACTLPLIQNRCQAGTGCGACVNQIRKLLENSGTVRRDSHQTISSD